MKASFRVERQKLALCARFSKDCVFLRKIVQGFSSGWYVFVFVILLCLVSIVFLSPQLEAEVFLFLYLSLSLYHRGWKRHACSKSTSRYCTTMLHLAWRDGQLCEVCWEVLTCEYSYWNIYQQCLLLLHISAIMNNFVSSKQYICHMNRSNP